MSTSTTTTPKNSDTELQNEYFSYSEGNIYCSFVCSSLKSVLT